MALAQDTLRSRQNVQQQFGTLANLQQRREQTNSQIKQADKQRMISGGVGAAGMLAAGANPYVAGAMLLTSLL